MKSRNNSLFLQRGGALIILVLVLVLAGVASLFSVLDGSDVKIERDKRSAASLSEAKAALIGYATRSGLATGTARPGDLPCPDINDDGSSDACAPHAIGRLPWRTLGINDLRDGDGERLWYAVSNNFKNNPRVFQLNSDTLGSISLRDSTGNMLNDGSVDTGLIAAVLSPGAPITRQDGVNQVRDIANINNPINYLDNVLGEDNQNFINGNSNGFIAGPIKDANGSVVLNDKVISITQNELFVPVEQRVAMAAANALLDYFCGLGNANYVTKTCLGAGGVRSYPRPANFADASCLGLVDISASCSSDMAINHGRLPANVSVGWTPTSILRGDTSTGNWFQQNGWREQIYYAVAPACVFGTTDCDGAGGLIILNTSLVSSINTGAVVIASGKRQLGQLRITNADKSNEANFVEDENLTVLDNIYTRISLLGIIFNDRVASIP